MKIGDIVAFHFLIERHIHLITISNLKPIESLQDNGEDHCTAYNKRSE